MKIKLDQNIPVEVARRLAFRHDVDTVLEEGLSTAPDDEVWRKTQRASRFLVTQDLDFSDLRKFLSQNNFGILLVRLKNPSRSELVERIVQLLSTDESNDWPGCFVIATDSKLRVRRS